MTALLGWLVGSKIGRYAALAALGAGLIAVLAWMLMAKGAAAERAKNEAATAAKTISVLLEKVKVDESIRAMSPAARRQRLRDYAKAARGE